jgi:type I restriction enzyme S subunit
LRPLLAGYIGGGWGNDERDEDFTEPGAVIRGTDIPDAVLGLTSAIPRRFHKQSNIRSRRLVPGDIIFEVSGGSKDQPVGRALFCSDHLLRMVDAPAIPASFCKRLSVNQTECDSRFLYYFLLQIYKDRRVAQWQVQSTGISNFQFEAFLDECELLLPTLPEQRRIASILFAYDDLIENNTRRIAILEEMARRIYEEWFVRFRFPGHENVRIVESELGPVPEGWAVSTLGESAAYINRGIAPKYDDCAHGLVINQKCIRNQRLGLAEARRQSKAIPREKQIVEGDVLINSTGVGTLGRVAQVLEPLHACTVDTHVSIVRPAAEIDRDYFGMALLNQQQHFESQGVGSTGQTELSRTRIAETRIVLAPNALQRKFGAVVRPMRQLGVRLAATSLNLSATRDLLLPKLISGELDVSALPVAEAVAA